MKLKKMYFFIFIIGTALLSQSYGAGGAAAVRLLRQGLQNGIDAISRAGVSESTAKTLLDHYGNLSRAMGLPEGATIDDWRARLDTLGVNESDKTRFTQWLSNPLRENSANELLALSEPLTTSKLMRSYYFARGGVRNPDFFPRVTFNDNGIRGVALENLASDEVKRLASEVPLGDEAALNRYITARLRRESINVGRRELTGASFGSKAQIGLILTAAESTTDDNLKSLAGSIVRVMKSKTSNGENFFNIRTDFSGFLYSYNPYNLDSNVPGVITILNDMAEGVSADGMRLDDSLEQALRNNVPEAELNKVDDAVNACVRAA